MFTTLQTLSLLTALSGAAFAGLVPQQRDNICGVRGYDRGKGNIVYDDSNNYNTLATCSALCAQKPKCKSFGFGDTECMLFNIALTGNFDADPGSSDTYYDFGCITPSPIIIKATTTSSQVAFTSSQTSTQSLATTLSTVDQRDGATSSTSTSKPPTTSSSAGTSTGTKVSSSSLTSSSSSKPSSSSITTSSPGTMASSSSSSTPATSTASSAKPSVSIPAACASTVPATLSMTRFFWFNSTHNLDCANPNFPADAKVCWNSNGVCANDDPSCTCTPYCYTGLPPATYQPLGFGPADTIQIGFSGGSGCSAANPQSFRRNEIGEGHFDCGSAADYIGFYGDSNKNTGNTGSVYYNAYGSTCNGMVPRYTASFPLTCTRDAGNNASCTAPIPLPLTLVSLG